MTSKSIGTEHPAIPHLVRSGMKGGLAGEIADLRNDVDTGFVRVETPGNGGTGVIAVEEFINVAAASVNAIKTAAATVAAITTYSGTALNGAIGAGAISPPRNITFTTAGITPADAPATALITGLDVEGAVQTETVNLAQIADTVAGSKAFASVTSIRYAAADGVDATVAVGIGNQIGLSSKVKLRNTIPNILAEMVDGAFVGGGAGDAAATATNIAEAAHTHPITSGTTSITVNASTPAVAVPRQDTYLALTAPGTNYVAQYAAGAAINDAVGPFVVPRYPFRTARIVLGATVVPAVVYTINGTDAFGNVVQDVINAAGAGTYEGAIAFATITSFLSDVDPGGTTDLRTGNGFCLSSPVDTAITELAVTEVVEAPVSVHLTSGTVVPTTAPNGAHNFIVRYNSLPTSSYPGQDVYMNLSAPGTNYVAQYAGGAPIADIVGPFVIPTYPFRTARIVLGVGGANPTVYTIDGTDAFGNVVQDIITAAGAGTYEGDVAFGTITGFASDVDPGGTTDLRVGNGFCLSDPIATAITRLVVDEVVEAPVAVGLATGTVVPTTVPNAAHDYLVRYPTTRTVASHTHPITDGGHAHGAVTGAGSSHNHTQNAHNHGAGGATFVAPATGAPNGTFAPATAPNGAHDYVLVYERDNS